MKSRSRSRTRFWTGTTTLTHYNNNVATTTSLPQSRTLPQSVIVDVTGNPRGYNSVAHTKADYTDASWRLPKAQDPNDSKHQYDVSVGSVIAHYGRTPPFREYQLDYSQTMKQLYDDAIGAVDIDVNLVVNAAEIASLKELVPQILKIGGGIMKKGLGKKSLKELANGHLLYSFGIVPLITDIKGLLNIRSTVRNRIRQLEARNGRVVRLTKRVPPVTTEYELTTTSSVYPHTQEHKFNNTCVTSGSVSCDVSSFFVPGPESSWRIWSQALGLSTPLQSSWELVPFSFVWDWVFPIGKAIKNIEGKVFKKDTVKTVTLSNFAYSLKNVNSCAGITTVVPPCYPAWKGRKWNDIGGTITSYSRGTGVPPDGGVSAPLGWSIAKSALSVSLIAQKVLK